jgi:non-specific serine/threonine protein kinase
VNGADDPLQAAQFAASLRGLWQFRGPVREGIGQIEGVLTRDWAIPPLLKAFLLLALGMLRWVAGDGEQARSDFAACRDLDHSFGGGCLAAWATNHLALIDGWDLGDFAAAVPLFEEAVATARALPPDASCGILPYALGNLGIATTLMGDPARGVPLIEEALAMDRAAGHDFGAAMRLYHLGLAAQVAGQVPTAAERYAESLRIHRACRVVVLLVPALIGLAGLAAKGGRADAAARLLGMVAAIRERTGSARDRGSSALWEPIQVGTEETCRAALGQEAFAAAVARGRALPVADAVEDALAVAALLASGAESMSGSAAPRTAAPELLLPVVPSFGLSPRELEVLALLARRYTDPEIAGALFISPHTASTHVKHVLGKLGAANRREAAALAARHGLA